MPTQIRHLSIGVNDPKQAAEAVAELTRGKVSPFHPVKNGYVCLWSGWAGQFIEFYPKDIRLVLTNEGADFQRSPITDAFHSTHLNLTTDLTGDEVKNIAKKYSYHHYFRPSNGGPLHEVWIDDQFLLELVTKELQ